MCLEIAFRSTWGPDSTEVGTLSPPVFFIAFVYLFCGSNSFRNFNLFLFFSEQQADHGEEKKSQD